MDGRQLMAFQPFNQAGPIHFIYLNGELKHTVNSLMELRRGGLWRRTTHMRQKAVQMPRQVSMELPDRLWTCSKDCYHDAWGRTSRPALPAQIGRASLEASNFLEMRLPGSSRDSTAAMPTSSRLFCRSLEPESLYNSAVAVHTAEVAPSSMTRGCRRSQRSRL